MKNAIIAQLLNKIVADATGAGSGHFKMGKLKFREGGKECRIEGLETSWDFKDTTFSFKEGKLAAKGHAEFKLTIAKITITSVDDDGELEIEDIEIDKIDDIGDLLIIMPIKEMKRLADLRDAARPSL